MRSRTMILLLFLMVLIGCASNTTYVIQDRELVRVHAGQNLTAGYDGWVISDRAVKRVMQTKINDANLN